MTAFSFENWTSMSADEQKAYPGISIERDHPVNNLDRGYYWSPKTSAEALSHHVEGTLAGDDEVAARRMWNSLKKLHREGVNSDRAVDRAMSPRQADAHAALGAYNGDLNHEQLEQLASVYDDVVRLQKAAEDNGVDPQHATSRFLTRAAARAVGYDVDDNRIEPNLRPLVQSEDGSQAISNMNQSVRQLSSLMRGMELDALDYANKLGTDMDMSDELRDEQRRLEDVLKSIPTILTPRDVQPERNFSVRMETQEEATAMETMVRWAGTQDRMPEAREVHRAFASWRDSGMAVSPYSPEREGAVALVTGNTNAARETVGKIVKDLDEYENTRNAPVVILTTEANQQYLDTIGKTGREIVPMVAEATAAGVSLVAADGRKSSELPGNRIELVNLSLEQAANSVDRSLAVNAVVARASGVGYVAGETMSPVEAQAVHLAGTLRKLSLGMTSGGGKMGFAELREVRQEARDVDAAADPQRYYTAGHSRPFEGVSAVAFSASRNFDAAEKAAKRDGRLEQDRSVMGEAYASIPKSTAILVVDNDKNSLNKWLESNATDRPVLYAEATRRLSFAEIVSASGEGQKRMARESGMDFKIYDVPPAQREYGMEEFGGPRAAGDDAPRAARMVCKTPEVSWDDPRVRKGAIIMVSGMASDRAHNSTAQAVKVAQEAVTDRANSALVLHDFRTDYNSAAMIMYAANMGKKTTVLDGAGREHPLAEARAETKQFAQSFTEVTAIETGKMSQQPAPHPSNKMVDVAAGDDLGQMAIAGLPGMDAARAIRFAHLPITINEMRTDKSEEMRKMLIDNGMPAETRAVINDDRVWKKALESAIDNQRAADQMGAQLHAPTDAGHPIEAASGGLSRHSVYSMGGYDFEKQPLAAFIGSSERHIEPGRPLSLTEAQNGVKSERYLVDPADVVDRQALRKSIDEMTKRGYGIAVTLEEGVSRAVLEEAANVRDAKVVMFASGNPQASSPGLRTAANRLFEQDRAAVIMPTSIAPHAGPDPKPGEERRPETYAENRMDMYDMLARSSALGLVVATSSEDQSLHIVDRMNKLDKPIAAMVPQTPDASISSVYSGNDRLLAGRGTMSVKSIRMAEATNAQAYAEIDDDKTRTELVDGVRRGAAGTFQSVKLRKNPLARSGNHYYQVGWQKGATAISSAESLNRFVDAAERGEGKLGQYVELTEREKEKIRLDREARSTAQDGRRERMAAEFTAEQFGRTSSLHRSAIMQEAGMSASR